MGIRKNNGYHRKKRDANTRKGKGIILIAAEGKNKTETNYLKEWNGKSYVIRFVSDTSTDPVNMVEALKKEYESKELDADYGDKAFCLVDHDCQKSKDSAISKADKIAKEAGVKVLVSNPCFELWYLCHFIFSTKQYTSSGEVISELRHYIPDYDKADSKTASCLIPATVKAIKNARKLDFYCENLGRRKHTHGFLPSTEVFELIELLMDVSQ